MVSLVGIGQHCVLRMKERKNKTVQFYTLCFASICVSLLFRSDPTGVPTLKSLLWQKFLKVPERMRPTRPGGEKEEQATKAGPPNSLLTSPETIEYIKASHTRIEAAKAKKAAREQQAKDLLKAAEAADRKETKRLKEAA